MTEPHTLTEHRDLRTGSAVWDAYAHVRLDGRKPIARKVDVVVIGAGVTGALVAEAMTSLGRTTLILDRRRPVMGSTAASTALLQFEIDTPLLHLIDDIGFEPARRAWRRSFSAVQGLMRLIHDHAIDCAARPRRAIYLSGNVLDAIDLQREADVRSSIGLPSRFLDGSELVRETGLRRDGAIVSEGSADLNPVQLAGGLLRIALERGAMLAAPVEVTDVVPLKHGVGLVTTDGSEVEADAVVFATGYELAKCIPTKGQRRSSTWAFATSPQPKRIGSFHDFVLWEAADPYIYIRSTIDGRIVVGGEDEDIDDATARDAMIGDKVSALRAKTTALMPWLDLKPDYSWAGTFGESDTGLPTIGPIPDLPHCYAVLGYGGNGITFGYLAAELLRGYLGGANDPDAALFAFKG